MKPTDWHNDVIGEEALVVPSTCNGIPTIEEDYDGKEDPSNPSENWRLIVCLDAKWQVRSRNTLCLHSVVESNIRHADHDPGEQSRNGGQVLKPREDCGGARRDAHEGEKANGPGEQDTVIWNAVLGTLKEDSWCLLGLGEGKQMSGTGVQEGVTRRSGRSQNDSVNDRWKSVDVGSFDGNDPGRCSGAWLTICDGLQQIGVIVWHEKTDGERSEDVKTKYSVEYSSYSLWNVVSRIFGLTSSHGDHFHTTVREGRVHHGSPEAQESTCVAAGNICFHSTRVVPVLEAKTLLPGNSTNIDDQT